MLQFKYLVGSNHGLQRLKDLLLLKAMQDGLFILFTGLDDERLMRHRVERLLCWRESAERWSCYQHLRRDSHGQRI